MIVVIMQGPSGSGKSTMAKKLYRTGLVSSVASADLYFENKRIPFDAELLPAAHGACLAELRWALRAGRDVAVDNKHILQAHAQPYIDAAIEFGAVIYVVRCHGRFQNVHNVPAAKVEADRERMETLKLVYRGVKSVGIPADLTGNAGVR
jgi:ABC-type dipeptide/oligopeptide/nickel transport system ATPase component